MIIYIHGFNSSGGGDKYKRLKRMFPDIEIYSPSYDSADFTSIDNILDGIELDGDTMFIGNSLGGYIAMYLAVKHKCKCVLLNPSTDPTNELKQFIGANKNFSTNEEYVLTQDDIDVLSDYKVDLGSTPVKIFVTKDDEVIEYRKIVSFFKIRRFVNIMAKGGHRFQNLEIIKRDLYHFYNQI